MSREFCWDVPDPWRRSISLCKKKFVRIFRSLLGESQKLTYGHVRGKIFGNLHDEKGACSVEIECVFGIPKQRVANPLLN